jgi:alpha-1,2-mannosyltransferase
VTLYCLLSFITAASGNPEHMGIPQAQTDTPIGKATANDNWHWLWAIALAAIAFAFRLVPVLRGGGLFGLGNYDDGVYYAAATGLVHGRLPYQDFLLLHPPGMLLLLMPFALGAQLASDSYGFAAARVAWMLLGALNAVLVWRILKPIGLVAALLGGLSYAVFYPAVYADKSTLLESPATTALLLAIILLEPVARASSLPRGRAIAAGALLGFAVTIKVWGVVTVLIVLGWLLLARRFRGALHVLVASALTAALICLPFFATAPTAMWNQIVRDQLFRRGGNDITFIWRLDEIVGLGIVGRPHFAITLVAVFALLCCTALAWSYREARLAVLLFTGQTAFLLVTPTWFAHYAGFTAAPVALVVGAAIGRVIALVRARPAQIAVGVVTAGALAVYASGWSDITFGRQFPSNFRSLAVSAPGCITSDDATALVATDTLSRNLSRGCRFIADLGGNSHDLAAAAGVPVSRKRNKAFQRFAISYLRAGSVTILMRYSDGRGFNAKTTAALDRWPLLARSGRYQVRQPVEPGLSAMRGSPKPQRR